jgi:hypothetical protein
MTSNKSRQLWQAGLAFAAMVFLMAKFGRFFQNGSFDLVQHYLLIDEIMKHGGVRPDAYARIGAMAVYPPAAHWMAALLGWIAGSGLVGMNLVTIAAVFVCYLFIVSMVSEGSWSRIAIFFALFLAFRFTGSMVGWEVRSNFFYPQLVADALYFGCLFWMARVQRDLSRAFVFIIGGFLTMWVQPLIAVHIFATGLALLAFECAKDWIAQRRFPLKPALVTLGATLLAAAIVVEHPAFKVMRAISANDGYLAIGYSQIMLVASVCALLGVINMSRYVRSKAGAIDAVIASAVIGAAMLTYLQFALLKLHGDGSAYAVKKHMFLVFTLGSMNFVRLAGSALHPARATRLQYPGLGIVAAAVMSSFALKGFDTPVAPVVRALTYADRAVVDNLPPFRPGNTAADDASLPLIANVMISLTSFQHPFDARAIAWQEGASIKRDIPYVMVRRTDDVDRKCQRRYAEGQEFVVVEPACLKRYTFDSPLNFSSKGNAASYLGNGWGAPEEWGAWSLGNIGGEMDLVIPSGTKGPLRLQVDAISYVNRRHPSQEIIVEVNGKDIANWKFEQTSPAGRRSALIPADLVSGGSLHIVFKAPGAVSPAQMGESADARSLGIGLKTFTLVAPS